MSQLQRSTRVSFAAVTCITAHNTDSSDESSGSHESYTDTSTSFSTSIEDTIIMK